MLEKTEQKHVDRIEGPLGSPFNASPEAFRLYLAQRGGEMTAAEAWYLAKLDALETMRTEPVFHGNGTVTAAGTAEDLRRAAAELGRRIEVDTRTPRQRFDSAAQLARARHALNALKTSTQGES